MPLRFLSVIRIIHPMKNQSLKALVAKTCLFLTVLAASLGAIAAKSSLNFYEANVAVRSQAAKERQYAAQKGLQQVLVRMSGSASVLKNSAIQSKVSKAESYVQQFQYFVNDNQNDFKQGKKQLINFVYSSKAVEQILRDAGEPFWPTNRPSTVVWMVEDDPENGRQFVSKANSEELVKSLQNVAYNRGLPLVFPLYDLEDRVAITENKLWALDNEAILQASQRYKPGAILLGRLSKTSRGDYLANWEFIHNNSRKAFDSRTEDLQQLSKQVLFPVADYFSSRYAIVSKASESPLLVIQVSGVGDFADYRSALSYLENLAIVSDVALSAIRRDSLLILLESDSSLSLFESTLSLDNKLVAEGEKLKINAPAWEQVPRGTMTNPLQYRWSG